MAIASPRTMWSPTANPRRHREASNLVYSNQSGALNESYSDIFGEAVDQTNGSGNDTPGVKWLMGEDLPHWCYPPCPTHPLQRSGQNQHYRYYCGTGDNGGVHTNSGVANKAFALMVDGGSFNGYTVDAIGLDQAVRCSIGPTRSI